MASRPASYLRFALAALLALPAVARAEEPVTTEPAAVTPEAAPAAVEPTPVAPEPAAVVPEPVVAPVVEIPQRLPVPDAPVVPPLVVEPAPAPAAPEPEMPEQVLVVTGSRVGRKDLNTAAPVTIVTRKDIRASGRTSIGDVLQALPSQSNAVNTQVNNSGDGSTRVNLRGLGESRTLVLLNGRRFVSGGLGADSSVDLNAIPMAAIERIEILKDGASAIYGSDAIGGVVNIITRKDWQGTDATMFSGISQRGDGVVFDASVTTGQKTERSSFMFSAGYSRQTPVWAGDRAWSKFDRDYDFTCTPDAAKKGTCQPLTTLGSSAIPGTYLRDAGEGGGNAAWTNLTAQDKTGDGTFTRDLATGQWRPYNGNGVAGGPEGGDQYNYQPRNYNLTPQERVNFFAIGDLTLGVDTKFYYEALFTNRRSDQLLAPEPLFTSDNNVTVSKDSIYNPFGRDFTDVRRRLVEFDDRSYHQDLDTYRVVGGLTGKWPAWAGLLKGWTWDVALNYGRTTGSEFATGSIQASHLAAAVGPSYRDEAGVAHCGTKANTLDGCVPLDLFGGPGSITPEMRNWLSFNGIRRGFTDQAMLSMNTGGELFTLKANRPASIAFGYELRRETGGNFPDPLTVAGDTSAGQESATSGGFTVNEGFAEILVPVVSGVTGIEDLELGAAARVFRYDTFGAGATYKLGGRWAITKDFTLRGTFSTAFRAPSIAELYAGKTASFNDVTDPCSTANGPRSAIAQKNCQAAGVPDELNEDRSQLRTIWSGDTTLKPEKARAFTVGAVYVPAKVRGLTFTLDYYRITVTDAIARVESDVILNSCYLSDNPQYCDRVHRNAQGFITKLDDPNTNVGGDTTGGVDVGARYDLPTRFGKWRLTLDVNWLQDFVRTFANRSVDGKGNYDLQGVYPALRGLAGLQWGLGNVGAGLHARYVGSFRECENNQCVVATPDPANPVNARAVEAYTVLDFFGSYDLETAAGTTSFMFGINNLLDHDPVAIYNGQLVKTDASAYDFVGRFFFLRLSHAL